jgi:hypothetical protein
MLAKEALKKEKKKKDNAFLSFSIACACTGAIANSALIAKAINAKSVLSFLSPFGKCAVKERDPAFRCAQRHQGIHSWKDAIYCLQSAFQSVSP